MSHNEVPISPKEYNEILDFQQTILEKIAARENYITILEELCFLAEKLLPNAVASIMMLNKSTGLMSVLVAPSVPQAGHDALENLQPGSGGGSCGNAVFKNEAQYVSDTFNDSRWEDLRQVAVDYNLCSCWSTPVRDEKAHPLGTFALSSFEHRSPAPFHKKLLEVGATIVKIVLSHRETEQQIKLFSSAAQNATEGILITDAQKNIIEINEAFTKIYGYTKKDILGKNPRILSSGQYDDTFYKAMWQRIENTSKYSGELTNHDINGNEIVQWTSISAIKDENNRISNYLAIFSDLTALKKAQEKSHKAMYIDDITKLHNKVYLDKLLSSNTAQTLILLNVNNFSYINTAYGFAIGDKLLQEIANILKYNFKTQATCRVNSDEFAMLFETKINIKNMVNEIKQCFYSQEITINDIKLNISFTYGASYGSLYNLRNSALALKQAKEHGKNALYIFKQDEENIDQAQRQSFIEANNTLHDALNEDAIIPFFQGIRDNKTKTITKFECLARIRRGTEIISPYQFLEPAKLSGLLPEITKVMIDKSFQVMQANNFTFSINITEDDLSQRYLLEYITQKSLQYNISPSRVILEILEGVSSNSKRNNLQQLRELKKAGYSIAIDDFGTEYSNFERVLDLEIDFLKIDAKYIKDIDTNPKSYEITKAIAFFAHNANIPCIAEFVHNESIQKIIKELAIDYTQGYLYSEPALVPIGG